MRTPENYNPRPSKDSMPKIPRAPQRATVKAWVGPESITVPIEENDVVYKPSHYQLLPGVEVIDVRDAIFDKMPADVPHDVADCWSRSWEYLTRMWGKNGLEDAKKARFYLDRMIQKIEVKDATDRR